MQNAINFSNTKIEDINEIIAIAQHGDLKIVYNKQDNFICCSALVKLLEPNKDTERFFKLQSTQAIFNDHINAVTELSYKISRTQMHTERGQYSGYYIHQDLFYAFMLWLCPSKFIQYSRLLNLILQNITIENQIQNKDKDKDSELNLQTIIDKLQIENQELIQKLNNQTQISEIKDQIIDDKIKVDNMKQQIIETKASINISEEIRIFEKGRPLFNSKGQPLLDEKGKQKTETLLYISAVKSNNRNNGGMKPIKVIEDIANSKDLLVEVKRKANLNSTKRLKLMDGNWCYLTLDHLLDLIQDCKSYYMDIRTENKIQQQK
ncbi:DNA-binding [Hexamita inflata]|uniref:DNA-binding n=1 Tax=Hexamita inflata TaxID=28002 RepID=A0AA86PA06_9EUKA|nr:DNA-binding [Hexamita inflata]